MTNSQIAFLKLVLSVLFIGCLWDWEYGYYQLVRFVGVIGFVILAYNERENKVLLILWVTSALLINPFFKIALGRTLWNIIDVIWAVLLILSSINKLEPIRNYLRNRRIKNLLHNATRYIFSSNGDFESLTKRFVKGDNQLQLATYCVLEVSSLRVPSSEEERLLEVLTIYSENLQKVLNSDFEQIIEIQKTKAEIEFLKTKTAFLIAEQTCIEGNYSFECMRHKMERAKRGPLTQIEWGDILDKAKKIDELDKKIDDSKREKTDQTKSDKPSQGKKKSTFDDASPNQRRLFEKMGALYKVTKPETDDNKNKSNDE